MLVTLVDDAAPEVVFLAVADGSARQPQERRFSADAATGRGLRLLQSIAVEWGVETEPDGKTVWCRLRLGAEAGTGEFDLARSASHSRSVSRRCPAGSAIGRSAEKNTSPPPSGWPSSCRPPVAR